MSRACYEGDYYPLIKGKLLHRNCTCIEMKAWFLQSECKVKGGKTPFEVRGWRLEEGNRIEVGSRKKDGSLKQQKGQDCKDHKGRKP
eukprot:1145349-Pelagomonas_calceolata.AAC.9